MSVSNPPQGEPMDAEALLNLLEIKEGTDVGTFLAALHHWHNQQAYKEVLELIGEDEPPEQEWLDSVKANMLLRAKLRQAAKEKYQQ